MKSSNSLSRRKFIKGAALAGAAPFILPSSVWSQETSPNSKLNVGFVGVGAQGTRTLMANALRRDDMRILAVCDVDTKRRNLGKQTVEGRYGGGAKVDTYSNFEELFARKDIDAVLIATPDHWHALVSIAAANAGKDIYCEKPMAHTVHEGRAMVNAVRKNNRVFQTGSMQRSSREFRIACELVRNGVIGDVKKADVEVGGPGRACTLPEEAMEEGLDWSRWLGPAPMRGYSSVLSPRGMPSGWPDWRSYWDFGGGMVCDWGAHHFDIAQWAFGFDDTGPVEIVAAEGTNPQFGAVLRYANGVEVTHHKDEGRGIVFYGDKGKIQVNRGKFSLWLGNTPETLTLKTNDTREASIVAKELLPANAVRLYSSDNHMGDWVDCIHKRSKPICDVEVGHRSASVCALVNQSYYHHATLKWDPAKEEFTGGTGNPAWLTREYRAPWNVG